MKGIEDRTYEQPWGLFSPGTFVTGVDAPERSDAAGRSEHRRGSGGDDRAATAGREPLHRLDLSRNNVTPLEPGGLLRSTGRIMAKPHRCRCRTCSQCGPIYGRKARSRLLLRSDVFKHPALLTLTLKPSHFDDDPSKAYLTVTDGKFIARLMKLLGVTRWVWVLEFQQSGWPHWHLLIDKPGSFLDLKKAWHWWGWNRTRWKLGGVDLGKQQTKDGRHAIFYISKYLVKYPEHGFPDWLLDLKRRVRFVGSSKEIGAVVSDRERIEPDAVAEDDAEAAASLPPEHRTLRVREASCGHVVEFLREFIDAETGAITYRFCGRLDWAIFEYACRSGSAGLQTDEQGREYVPDHGNMRVVMSKWIGDALRAGVNADDTRDEREAARIVGPMEWSPIGTPHRG